jgi:hypothetical protein
MNPMYIFHKESANDELADNHPSKNHGVYFNFMGNYAPKNLKDIKNQNIFSHENENKSHIFEI